MTKKDTRITQVALLGMVGALAALTIDLTNVYHYSPHVDIFAHFCGGLATSAIVYFYLTYSTDYDGRWRDAGVVWTTAFVAMGWEVIEVFSPWHSGFYVYGWQDTQGDVLAVVLGAVLVLWIARRYSR